MTKDEIRALIAAKIAGQGTNIDAGNALPPVLEAILDLIGGGGGDAYTKAETDELLSLKQNLLTAGIGIDIDDTTGEISVTLDNTVAVVLPTLPEPTEDSYQLYRGKIVLIPDFDGGEGNWFKEYVLYQMPGTTGYRWEIIGEYKADIDLSDYYTKTETDEELAKKQDKLSQGDGISINSTTNKISVDAAQESDFTDEDIATMADVTEQEGFKLLGNYTQELFISGTNNNNIDLINSESPEFAEYYSEISQTGKIATPKKAYLRGEGKTITFTDFEPIWSDGSGGWGTSSAITAGGCVLEISFLDPTLFPTDNVFVKCWFYPVSGEAPEWVGKTINLTLTFEY